MAVSNFNEALAEFACNGGADHSDQAWLLHDCDVWVRNPNYRGPAVPHPENDDGYCEAHVKAGHTRVAWVNASSDDIPF